MNRTESTGSRIAMFVPLAVGLFAFAQSYRGWLEPVIDAGRDLYIPEQLRQGVVLYRDINYIFPPLTPYLLAAITALTGSSLGAYIGIGLAMALLTALAIWLLVKPLAGSCAASAALLVFFSYSMCGVRGFGDNYFFPYAHAATLGMGLFVWAIVAIQRGRFRLATVLLLAASWTKIEYAAFAVALLMLMGLRKPESRNQKPEDRGARGDSFWSLVSGFWFTPLLLYAIGMAAIAAFVIVVFGADELSANLFLPSVVGESSRLFYAKVTGTNEWQANLLLAVKGAALVAAFIALLRAWDRLPRLRLILVLGLGIATWLLVDELFFRAWTILQVGLVPFALRRPREPLALLLLASLCASSRIYLRIVPIWYGFVYIIPVVLLVVYVLFEWLPEHGVYARKAALAWLPLLVLVCGSGLLVAHRTHSRAFPVVTKRGTYFDTSAARANATTALLRHLDRIGARELVVMPEGLTLNYLAAVRTPLRHHMFTPVDVLGSEALMLAELQAKRPRYVVLQPRAMSDYGYQTFGEDYGQTIVAWLHANYVVERRFALILLLRRAAGPAAERPVRVNEAASPPTLRR